MVVRIALVGALAGSALAKAITLVEGRGVSVLGVSGIAGWAVTAGLGVAECVGVALLIAGKIRLGASWVFALGTGFGAVTVSLIGLGYPLAVCGCFGRYSVPVSGHLAMVFGILLGSRFLMLSEWKSGGEV